MPQRDRAPPRQRAFRPHLFRRRLCRRLLLLPLVAKCSTPTALRAFEEAGDPFDPATAERLYNYIYSGGGSRDFAEAYRLFRGRDPDINGLLEKRGFADSGAARGRRRQIGGSTSRACLREAPR